MLLEASHAFTSAIKEGPDYVCVCCNQLMYRKTVHEFQVSKYDKAPGKFVIPECISAQDKQWICKTCHNALKRGLLPAQAKANNLDVDDIPVELSDLNPLETSHFSSNPFHEDSCTSLWQAVCHSWASRQRTHWSDTCVHPSPKTSISNPDGSNEAKEKAELQGTLCISVPPTSEDNCSPSMVEIKQSTVQGHTDQRLAQWCCRGWC